MLTIKEWWIKKNYNQQEAYLINSADLEVLKETEKAVQIKASSDYGTLTFWCPKSCIEELEAEKKYEDALPIGSVINHTSFGKGTVLMYSGAIVTIDFNGTIKKLSAEFVIEKCEIA